jgi:hypothetical protein
VKSHDEEIAVICLTTDTHSSNVPGSTREYCSICAAEVWCSPASRLLADVIICMDCAPGAMEATGGELSKPTPEQLREVMENWP